MKISTLVCNDRAHATPALDHQDVEFVEDLCRRPSEIAYHAADAERLVLVLHPADASLADVQTGARESGIDPLGVQIVDATEPAGRLRVSIAAARAQAAAFGGSSPEQVMPEFQHELSRRSLLRFPRPHYVGAPSIDTSLCAAGDGCHACVETCPQDAYRWVDGRIEYDKAVCEPCGRCVTACPAAAIDHPEATPAQVAARVDALVSSGDGVGVAFVCRRGSVTLEDDWYPVEVPCTGMVPSTWLLAGILLGAASMTAVACGESGCPLEHDHLAAQARNFARSVLGAFNVEPERVPDRPVGALLPPLPRVPLEDPFGVHGMAGVAAGLATLSRDAVVHVADPSAPIGIITIDPSTCTLCTMCSQTCPTGALEHRYVGRALSISFDTTLCTACGQCTVRCPELRRGAIRLDPVFDSASIAGGRHELNAASTLQCEACGGPIAPAPMMDRISSLLGDEHSATLQYVSNRCLDCRGVAPTRS